MDENIKNIEYRIKDLSEISDEKLDEVLDLVKGINKVLDAAFDKTSGTFKYIILSNSSDYEIFAEICSIFDQFSIDFDNDDIDSVEVADIQEEEDSENDLTNEVEKKKSERKFDVIEGAIILSLSLVLIILGFIFREKNASSWIYMFGFVLAGYETLYSLITDFAEKRYVGEKIIILVSAFALLYLGFGLSGCLVMFSYSFVSFLRGFLEYKNSKLFDEEVSDERKEKWNEDGKDEQSLKKIRIVFDLSTVAVGLLIAFVPPLFDISRYWYLATSKWIYLGVTFVALTRIGNVLASLKNCRLSAISKIYKSNVIISDNQLIEGLSEVDTIFFDGKGVSEESEGTASIRSAADERELKRVLFAAEQGLNCSVARAILGSFDIDESVSFDVSSLEFFEGQGVKMVMDGKEYLVGSKNFLSKNRADVKDEVDGDVVYISKDGVVFGVIELKFPVKKDVVGAVAEISEDLNVRTVLLSGCGAKKVERIRAEIGFSSAAANCSPDFKAKKVVGKGAVYVCDSVNDLQTISKFDDKGLIVKLGGEDDLSSGLFLKDGEIRKLPFILKILRRLSKTLRQTKVWSIIGKAVLIAAAFCLKIFLDFDFTPIALLLSIILDVVIVLNSVRNHLDPA